MITRRQLLVAIAALGGGGLVVGFAPQLTELEKRIMRAPVLGQPGWIWIDTEGAVRLYCTLTEMGQGVWSALAQIVNEELQADPAKISVETAPTWRAYNAPVGFFTGGSTSIERIFTPMRSFGAAARLLLLEAAAGRWRVPMKDCYAAAGYVYHKSSDRRAGYGELAPAAARLRAPANPPLKPRAAWTSIGRPLARLGSTSKVDGTAMFGLDTRVPGMLIAAVSQSPWPATTVKSIDRKAALDEPGVLRIVDLGDTIAVLAHDYWSAARGLKRANVAWHRPAHPPDTQRLVGALRERAESQAPPAPHGARAGTAVSATYQAPLLMHAQLEPLNATAHVHEFAAELWAPTQAPARMQHEVAKALFTLPQAVTVHTTRVGGGFGRRLIVEEGVAAARIAKVAGVPVKAIWSREQDSLQDCLRPMAVARLTASLDATGSPRAWSVHVASLGGKARTTGLDPTPYSIADNHVRYSGLTAAIRVGYWRSVDASQNVFFRECFVDECAHAAGVDPLQYRVSLLGPAHSRGRRVLAALATACRWSGARAPNRFVGLAYHEGFRSVTAQAVELSRNSGGALHIERIVVVADCGTAVNPDNIRAQLEGGALFALSAALQEEATIEHGSLRQRNFDTYQVLRMHNAPPVEVTILETADARIGGIGEVAVPPLAPALANAAFAATGTRVRRLPLIQAGLRWA